MKRSIGIAMLSAALLAAMLPVAASAQTLPNLTAVASQDMQVGITFAGFSTPQHLADAGAFSSMMIDQYNMVGIPSYNPSTIPDSRLVCHVNVQPGELVAVYGIVGQGVYEGAYLCTVLENSGAYVVWGR